MMWALSPWSSFLANSTNPTQGVAARPPMALPLARQNLPQRQYLPLARHLRLLLRRRLGHLLSVWLSAGVAKVVLPLARHMEEELLSQPLVRLLVLAYICHTSPSFLPHSRQTSCALSRGVAAGESPPMVDACRHRQDLARSDWSPRAGCTQTH